MKLANGTCIHEAARICGDVVLVSGGAVWPRGHVLNGMTDHERQDKSRRRGGLRFRIARRRNRLWSSLMLKQPVSISSKA
jgi:hypothetical protein